MTGYRGNLIVELVVACCLGAMVVMPAWAGMQLGGANDSRQTDNDRDPSKVGEYDFVCWQEGKEILRENGIGSFAVRATDRFDPVVTLSEESNQSNYGVVRVFSMGTSLCRFRQR